MIPRTPATGRFMPIPEKESLHSTSFSSTPSSSSSINSSLSTSLPARTLHYNTPSTPLLSTSLAPLSPSTSTPSDASIDAWKFDAETQLDRLISQAEYTLNKQRLLSPSSPPSPDPALTPWQEREMRDWILRFHQLKAESQSTLHSIQREIQEEKTKSDASPSPPPSPPSPTYVRLLESKLSALQAAYDTQSLETLSASTALSSHASLTSQLSALHSSLASVHAQLDEAQAAGRSAEARAAQQAEEAQAQAGQAEMWEAEYKREKAVRVQREGELGEERVRRRTAEGEGREAEGRERAMRGELEAVKGQLVRVKRSGERWWRAGVVGAMLLVLVLGVDKWMRAFMRSHGEYTF